MKEGLFNRLKMKGKKIINLITFAVIAMAIVNISIVMKSKNSAKVSLETIQSLTGENPCGCPRYGFFMENVMSPTDCSEWNPVTQKWEIVYIYINCCWTSLNSGDSCNFSLEDSRCRPSS
jgi:hypothetical protein